MVVDTNIKVDGKPNLGDFAVGFIRSYDAHYYTFVIS